MRIALVAPLVTTISQPYIGGAQAMVAELARGLVQRQHTVTLFAREGSFVPGVSIEPISIPDSVRPTNFSQTDQESFADSSFFTQANLFLQLYLTLQKRLEEFDVIHAHAFDWPSFVCSTLIHNRPIVHTLHLPAIVPEMNDALRILHQQGHPLSLITVSHACAQTYANYTPIDHIIYNGLDISAIPFSAHVPDDAPLLFAGRITSEKGVEAAIEIATRAKRHLLLAGGIYDQAYYTQKIAPRLEQDREHITYLGQLEHAGLWQIMSQASCLLFPIEWDEPFGLVAIEAMAAGTPVIAFRRGAAAEIIRHAETGFLVEAGDYEQAAAMVGQLSHISRRKCRMHVETHFSFAHMLDEHEYVYSAH